MVKAPKGYRHRTRKLLTKSVRERGAVPKASVLFYPYKVGDKVTIRIDPSFHKGMPHRRYHGLTGTIVGVRGHAYVVSVPIGKSTVKTIITYAAHLRPLKA
ncbi:MAG: 50S ribosomal protein L21e [Acidilobus sp.]